MMTKRKYIEDSDEEDEGEDAPPAKEVKLDRDAVQSDTSQRTAVDGNLEMRSTGSTGKRGEKALRSHSAHV